MEWEDKPLRAESLWNQYREETQSFQIQETIDRLLADAPSPRILEAGCGSVSHFRFKSSSELVGIDISQEQLDRNKAISKKILGDIQTYDLSGYNFDAVICCFVLEHLDHPELAMENFVHGLARHGMLIIESPNLFSFVGLITKLAPFWFHVLVYRVLFRKKLAATEGRGPFPTPFRMFVSPWKVKRFGERNGFKVKFFRAYQSYPVWKLCRQSKYVRMLLRILQALFHLLTLGRGDIFRGTYTVIMSRTSWMESRPREVATGDSRSYSHLHE